MTFVRRELEEQAADHIQAPEHLVREALQRTPKGQLVTVLNVLDLAERGFRYERGVIVAWPDWYDPEAAEG